MRNLRITFVLAVVGLLGLGSTMAFAQSACDEFASAVINTPVLPQNSTGLKRWSDIRPLEENVAKLVLIGDSLVESWPQDLALNASGGTVLNQGVGRDRIQNVLWRLDNFDTRLLTPSNVVLMLGTNNLGDPNPSACAIVNGLISVALKIQTKWPEAKLSIFSLLPRGQDFYFQDEVRINVNKSLAKWAETQSNVRIIQVDDLEFTCGARSKPADAKVDACAPGRACSHYRPDNLHLTRNGYEFLSKLLPRSGE